LYVRKNALQILIPKYGLEGTLFLSPRKGQLQATTFTYNEEVIETFQLLFKNQMQTYEIIYICFIQIFFYFIIRSKPRGVGK